MVFFFHYFPFFLRFLFLKLHETTNCLAICACFINIFLEIGKIPLKCRDKESQGIYLTFLFNSTFNFSDCKFLKYR